MITERVLIAGTRKEILEYFSFIGKDEKSKPLGDSIFHQISTISDDTIGYVSYCQDSGRSPDTTVYDVKLIAVHIRKEENK
jgi:hypothetical protein